MDILDRLPRELRNLVYENITQPRIFWWLNPIEGVTEVKVHCAEAPIVNDLALVGRLRDEYFESKAFRNFSITISEICTRRDPTCMVPHSNHDPTYGRAHSPNPNQVLNIIKHTRSLTMLVQHRLNFIPEMQHEQHVAINTAEAVLKLAPKLATIKLATCINTKHTLESRPQCPRPVNELEALIVSSRRPTSIRTSIRSFTLVQWADAVALVFSAFTGSLIPLPDALIHKVKRITACCYSASGSRKADLWTREEVASAFPHEHQAPMMRDNFLRLGKTALERYASTMNMIRIWEERKGDEVIIWTPQDIWGFAEDDRA